MEKELVSIIIPVYNVEDYLSRCVDSVINQTYAELEIILIDDGSTDSSKQICDSYRKKDPRIKVIHKENGGLSSARNAGIKESTGKYLMFVDSDDYISALMVESYYNVIKKQNAEMVVFTQKHSFIKKGSIEKSNKDILKFLNSASSYPAYIKMFDASIIRAKKLLFNENLKCCEDAPFIREYMLYCNRIAFIGGSNLYFYNPDNPNSLSKKGYLDYCKYDEVKLLVLSKLLNQIKISEEERKSYISYRAVHCIYCSMGHYFDHFKEDFDDLAIKTYEVLGNYVVSKDGLHEYSNWYNRFFCRNNTVDIESLKRYFRHSNDFANRIVRLVRSYYRNHI